MAYPQSAILSHPKRADIDAAILSGMSLRDCVKTFGVTFGSIAPYARKLRRASPGEATDQAQNILAHASMTSAKARKIMASAERYLRKAERDGNLKEVGIAIQSAVKACKMLGEALHELQTSSSTSITIGAGAQEAMALRREAETMRAERVSAAAFEWLSAQLEAREPEAMRMVGRLVRMLPSADPGALETIPAGQELATPLEQPLQDNDLQPDVA